MITCLSRGKVSTLRELRLLSSPWKSPTQRPLSTPTTYRVVQAVEQGGINELRVLELDGFGENALSTIAQCPQLKMLESLRIPWSSFGDYEDDSGRVAWASQPNQLQNLRILDVGRVTQSTIEYIILWLESGKALNLKKINLPFLSIQQTHDLVRIAKALEMQKLNSLQEFFLLEVNKEEPEVETAFLKAYQRNKFLTSSLVREPRTSYVYDSPFIETLRRYEEMNTKYVDLMKTLGNEKVSGTYGKVFLCGSARMGKTTLRRTLTKENSCWKLFSSFCEICSRTEEPSTRGIEVDHMSFAANDSHNQKLELAVWDLAGQNEYEVLHSAFLPNLALADGQATFFLIVCSANADQYIHTGANESQKFESALESLHYWLKFIASNSLQMDLRRRRSVAVVLNCFHDQQSGHGLDDWRHILKERGKEFEDFLDLHSVPFIVNAQVERQVSSLKEYIQRKAREKLQQTEVPKICADILQTCRTWAANNQKYPVLPWEEYHALFEQVGWPFDTIKAATTYLHETGHLVLFKKLQESEQSQPEDQFVHEAVLILDPEWLCRRVIGELLLPQYLLTHGPVGLQDNGSLKLALVAKDGFVDIPVEKSEEMVRILERLGLGYTLPHDYQHIFIPALIKDDNLLVWFNAQSQSLTCEEAWVTGFSLAAKDSKTLLPVVILRKLQVSLALEIKDKEGLPDSEFKAGISRISFKRQQVGVLVEYYRNQDNSQHNRLDILVKPLGKPPSGDDARLHRRKQVNLAEKIRQQTLSIAFDCCPGLELEARVIEPRACAEGFVPLQKRNVAFSVEKMSERMQREIDSFLKGDEQEVPVVLATNWFVDAQRVEYRDVLGKEDLRKVTSAFEDKSKNTESALKSLGLMPGKERFGVEEDSNVEPDGDSAKETSTDDPIQQLAREVSGLKLEIASLKKEMHQRFDQMESQIKGMTPELQKVLELQTTMNRYIHSLVTFTVEEKETYVPRLLYVTEISVRKKWLLQNIRSQVVSLHFLCEARYDDLKLHEVEGQSGVGITYTKEWAKKVAPILNWTFKIAVLGVKVASSMVIPGLDLLVPDFQTRAFRDVAQITGGVTDLISKSCIGSIGKNAPREYTTQAQEARRDALQYVQENVVGKLSEREFERQVGLWRVRIEDAQGHIRRVGWICGDCRTKYGKLAKRMPVNTK